MLTNTLKIPDNIKIEVFELILSQSDQKIRQKHCRVDLSSVFQPLTC